MSEQLEQQLLAELREVRAQSQSNGRPWRKPQWWGAWTTIIGVMVVASSWLGQLVLTEMLDEHTETRSLYARDVKASGVSLRQLSRENAELKNALLRLETKMDVLIRIDRTETD